MREPHSIQSEIETAPSLGKNACPSLVGTEIGTPTFSTTSAKHLGKHWHGIVGGICGRIIGRMKRGSIPLWLLRDLPALIGIAWRFWPLMIMVISSACRAIRRKPIDRSMYEAVMHMLPIAEAKLHDALCRQAWRALGWNVREVRLEILPPITKRVRRRQTLRGLSRPDDGPARSLVATHLRSSRHLPHPHTH